MNDNGIVSIAVGLTSRSYENDLVKMSSSRSDYTRIQGSYADLQGRVGDVERLLCAVRPKGKQHNRTLIVTLAFINVRDMKVKRRQEPSRIYKVRAKSLKLKL